MSKESREITIISGAIWSSRPEFWKVAILNNFGKFSKNYVTELWQYHSGHTICNFNAKRSSTMAILKMAILWYTWGAFGTLSSIYDGVFLPKVSIFIADIWQGSNAFELVDVSYHKAVWLRLTRIFECCECFRKSVATLIVFFFFWERVREAAHHHV